MYAAINFIVISILSISVLIDLIALILSVRIFVQYRNLPSVRILVIQLLIQLWIITVLIHNMLLRQNHSIEYPLGELGLSFLFLALIILSYMQINHIFERSTRLFATLAFGGFIFSLSYAISDLFSNTSYYEFGLSGSIWTLEMEFYVGTLIFLSAVSFVISFSLASKLTDQYPDSFISDFSTRVINMLALFIVIVGITLSAFFILFQTIAIPFAGPIMAFLISLLNLSYVYFNATQPFIHLGNGANPKTLLERHLIGYYVGTSFDTGPGLHLIDNDFLQIASLSKQDIELTIVGVITMIGLNDSFAERISLVPIPRSEFYLSLNITFQTSNSDVDDVRIQQHSPSTLGVIIPTIMAPAIRNLSNLQPIIQEIARSLSKIELITKDRVETMVVRILHEILY